MLWRVAVLGRVKKVFVRKKRKAVVSLIDVEQKMENNPQTEDKVENTEKKDNKEVAQPSSKKREQPPTKPRVLSLI